MIKRDPEYEKKFLKRIYARTKKVGDCWVFQGAIRGAGYSNIYFYNKTIAGHRAVLICTSGEWPDPKIFACHKCDNTRCINPEHLWWGTQKENMMDCAKKGRNAAQRHPEIRRGNLNPASKILEQDVLEIRKLYATGLWTHKTLGEVFGLKKSQICNITLKISWSHLR